MARDPRNELQKYNGLSLAIDRPRIYERACSFFSFRPPRVDTHTSPRYGLEIIRDEGAAVKHVDG
jgi:hypothetical protein